MYQEKYDSSLKYAQLAYQAATTNSDKKGLADANLMLGKLKLSSFDPSDEAIGYFLKSLELYGQLDDKRGLADSYLQLGVHGYSTGNYADAVDYLLLSVENAPNNKGLVETAHYLLAICYSELGEFDKSSQMFDLSAVEYGNRGPSFAANLEAFRGKMYSNKGDYQQAVDHHVSVLEKYQSQVKPFEFVPTYSFLSTAYLKTKDYPNAIKYGSRAYQMSKKRGAAFTYVQEAANNLQIAYNAIGNNDSAYYYLRKLSVLNDSLASTEILQRVARMKGAFDLERQQEKLKAEQDLKDAMNQKELENQIMLRNWFIGGFVLVMLFAALFLNQRNKVSKEKKRSDELLLNILPLEVANELKEKGEAQAKNHELVSILFTDFKDFTGAAGKMDAINLVSEINRCFKAFDAICEKYQVEKIKTIGDSYMAAGGLPIPNKDSSKNTVLASLEMAEYVTKRKAERLAEGKIPFEMRVGIHSGPVVAGIVGVKKFQYDIWGDTVNTASRMESNGTVGKVNISQATYELIQGDPLFEFEYRGKIAAKGKGEIDMWFVSTAEALA